VVDGEPPPEFDYESVTSLLAARGVTKDCASCLRTVDWVPLGPLGNVLFSIPLADLAGTDLVMTGQRTVLLGFAFVCPNCGFIRLYSRKALTQIANEEREVLP
jgi:predicted RNA-binding Zn-ribbon protein involved in translation (DUF1610 family)